MQSSNAWEASTTTEEPTSQAPPPHTSHLQDFYVAVDANPCAHGLGHSVEDFNAKSGVPPKGVLNPVLWVRLRLRLRLLEPNPGRGILLTIRLVSNILHRWSRINHLWETK